MTLKRKCYLGNGNYCRNYDEFEVVSIVPEECSVFSHTDDKITIVNRMVEETNLYNTQDTNEESYNYYALQLYVLNRKTGVTEYTTKRIAIRK